ncbi:MopE-related protein [Corallococcus terminator]
MKSPCPEASRARRLFAVLVILASVSCGDERELVPDISEEALSTKQQKLSSVRVPRKVAAGAFHSLFLEKDGAVWAWGQNNSGQLGTGGTTSLPQPTRVYGLPAIKTIAAGAYHSLALGVDGRVWAWGQNASGQAGLGSTGGAVLSPTQVPGLSNIQAIAANGSFSLALSLDGQLFAWGQNTSGQLGTGATGASVSSPVQVTRLPTIRAIAAGVNHTLALDADGQVWAWGFNNAGQVGTGSTSPSMVLTPTRVTGVPRAKAIAAGAGHSLLIDEQFGNVWAWGQNTFGQTGTGSATSTSVLSPSPVGGVFAATAIAAGHNMSIIIMGNGLVKTWGHNASGQLGNGTTVNSASPVDVTGLADARSIAAGAQHAVAVRPGCPVWAWGNNTQGQLGTSASTSTTPTTAPLSTLLTNTFYFDGDLDGFGDEFIYESACEPSPGFVEELDCDDYMPTTYPGAPEQCNGVDDSCDGQADDGNPSGGESCATGRLGVCAAGTTACTEGSVVCAQNRTASPEACDSLDNDCDGESDEENPGGLVACATGAQGICGEGVTYCTHGAIECVQKQGASTETCDGLDNDCDGQSDEDLTFQAWYRDQDGDNYGVASQSTQACARPTGHALNAGDCDDAQPNIHPGSTEVCDAVDNNCDGQADEGLATHTWYRDQDGDGFGAVGQAIQNCRQPQGYVANSSDCNDGNTAIKPGSNEVCDGVDNDCDAQVDEGTLGTWYRDQDGDGYGNAAQSTQACAQPAGYAQSAGDCNDGNANIRPGATETCDSVDNNCNGVADEGLTTQTWYRDVDGDGYGTASTTAQSCNQPSGYVSNASDCNDASSSVRPGASEVCDSVDNNCNGITDEDVKSTFYWDADGDGYGNVSQPTYACAQPGGYVSNGNDCNDGSASIRPGATEVCDSVDNNCNGSADEGLATQTWYRDTDGDGYGATSITAQKCSQPAGYVSNASDCNDTSASIRPGATETCDALDNNCDGSTDEGVKSTFYRDADGDGYGNAGVPTQACSQPAGYVTNTTDCNDTNAGVRPGASEVCDGADNNCNGSADEGLTLQMWYRDADEDGFGDYYAPYPSCGQPAGYVTNSNDCNDLDGSICPGVLEACHDRADNNCNGLTDEGCSYCPPLTECIPENPRDY